MTVTDTVDAVVVGAGHNGLVAANDLADAGWDVLVVDGAQDAGGAIRHAEVAAPGFTTDLFSAFYPMTVASPVITRLSLGEHGLRWSHAPTVLGHARPDAPAVLMHRDPMATATALEAERPGDGDAWLELHRTWERYGRAALDALLAPFPPVRTGARLAWKARSDLFELARMLVLPVRTLTEERFRGPAPALLLAGNALHADVTPEAAPSAMLGWMLCGLAQTVGFPVPVGGSGAIITALQERLNRAGGGVRLGHPIEHISVQGGRATEVHGPNGTIRARRAVIAACDAEILYQRLLSDRDVPPAFLAGMRRFHRASATVKVNWAVDGHIPWTDPLLADAGTVHVADSLDELTQTAAELAMHQVPARPFLLVGQMTTADPSRSPAGTESVWAYTHVPQEIAGDAARPGSGPHRMTGEALAGFVRRMEDRIEAHAPGFRSRVVGCYVQGPEDLEAANPSLVGGDISGGSAQMHQQLIFRPVPGFARPETPIAGLFLGSSSAHPGGSVHGACGANAARAALWHDRVRRARNRLSQDLWSMTTAQRR